MKRQNTALRTSARIPYRPGSFHGCLFDVPAIRFALIMGTAVLAIGFAQPTTASAAAKTGSVQSKKSDKSGKPDKSSKNEKGSSSDKAKDKRSSEADTPINPRALDDHLLSDLVFDLTNRERVKAGLDKFKGNRYLAASATGHSRDMASHNYFDHNSKGIFNRTSPRDRIEATGYAPMMSAENIAMIPTYNSQRIQTYPGYGSRVIEMDYNSYNRLARYAVQEWMQSAGHRHNILNPKLDELGVGTAIGIKNNIPYVYLTQNFGG